MKSQALHHLGYALPSTASTPQTGILNGAPETAANLSVLANLNRIGMEAAWIRQVCHAPALPHADEARGACKDEQT